MIDLSVGAEPSHLEAITSRPRLSLAHSGHVVSPSPRLRRAARPPLLPHELEQSRHRASCRLVSATVLLTRASRAPALTGCSVCPSGYGNSPRVLGRSRGLPRYLIFAAIYLPSQSHALSSSSSRHRFAVGGDIFDCYATNELCAARHPRP